MDDKELLDYKLQRMIYKSMVLIKWCWSHWKCCYLVKLFGAHAHIMWAYAFGPYSAFFAGFNEILHRTSGDQYLSKMLFADFHCLGWFWREKRRGHRRAQGLEIQPEKLAHWVDLFDQLYQTFNANYHTVRQNSIERLTNKGITHFLNN